MANFFTDLFGSKEPKGEEDYVLTTIPQAYRDAWGALKNDKRDRFEHIIGMIKPLDPLGLISWKTKLLNPKFGCRMETFRRRLEFTFGDDHLYSDDRIKQILDYKREFDYPHTVNDDTVLTVSQLFTLTNYIKGKENLWDEDSLREKNEKYENRIALKEREAQDKIDRERAIQAEREAERLANIEEGTQWLIDHGVPKNRLEELVADEKLIYANIEEAKRLYTRLIGELNTDIIVGVDVDLDIPMDAVIESIRAKLTGDQKNDRDVMRDEIKRLGKQFDEEYVKNAIQKAFGQDFRFSWTSAHYKRPNGCSDCEKTVFVQAYPRILF